MLEAEATADMLLMTQPFKAPSVSAPEIVEEPVAAQLVKAVLAGQRERFSALYEMYSPMVHGILLARVPRDYSAGLAKIIGNLTARYSLGFSLSEAEKDDGRMHELSLRVKASDAKGKTRKLEVSSRRGYFMPKIDADQTAANQ